MLDKKIDHFNIHEIASSGQCFRYNKINDTTYSVIACNHYLEIVDNGEYVNFSCNEEEWNSIWADYFDMSTDYAHIEDLVMTSNDPHLIEAYKEGSGIRILRQDLWEIIVTFMISQNNNIKRISNSVEAICKKAALSCTNGPGYRFPMATEVDSSMFLDKELGLGYRDIYLKEIYDYAASNPSWLSSLRTMSYQDAMASLLERKGIGKKVANCICLFGLHHIDAFPIDTHVKQLLQKYYSDGFDFERYKGYAGIIQQYLFYYELIHK